jgi:hypothetical protein
MKFVNDMYAFLLHNFNDSLMLDHHRNTFSDKFVNLFIFECHKSLQGISLITACADTCFSIVYIFFKE